jgi:sugar phosphate isomerase/epimerase
MTIGTVRFIASSQAVAAVRSARAKDNAQGTGCVDRRRLQPNARHAVETLSNGTRHSASQRMDHSRPIRYRDAKLASARSSLIMFRLRLAVATSRLSDSLRESIRLAERTGATGLQFDARQQLRPAEFSQTGRRQLLHSLSERNLQVASLAFPLRRPLHDQEQLEARLDAVKQAMQFAWDLKSRVLLCRIGRIVDGADSPEAVRQREVLQELAQHGNRVGVTLAVTPSGDSPEALRSLIDSIDDGPLGIDFDPAERVMAHQAPVASLRTLHDRVTHLTIRDALRDADGAGRETVVGRGEVPWEELLATLDEMTYSGWLTIDRRAGDEPLAEMTRAVSFISSVAGQS